MIKPEVVFEFNDPFISAASGLVEKNGTFYLVSDDENGFVSLLDKHAEFHQVFEGFLPKDPKERKKKKPDIESLIVFRNNLLLIPSFSKSNRCLGALVELPNMRTTKLSFENTMKSLTKDFKELNIEGSVIIDNDLFLQRGNGEHHENGLIKVKLQEFIEDTVTNIEIMRINLGSISNTPLSFTDAALVKNCLLFTAAAEASESTYYDGEFKGAVLGIMTLQGKILKTVTLEIPSKPEGIAVFDEFIYFVTDDDDRTKPSKLYKASFPSDLF